MPDPCLTAFADLIIAEEERAIASEKYHQAPEEDQCEEIKGS
jgi:hypothetical protein